jgi:hypothetical protein
MGAQCCDGSCGEIGGLIGSGCAIMKPIREDHPLKRFFRGLIDNAFVAELGLCNLAVIDYLADLLVDFVHVDRLRAIRNADGKPLDQVAEMLTLVTGVEDDRRPSENRRCVIYRHIGDYSLFWTGVYPEGLRHRRLARSRDRLLDYVHQGKRSYALASDLTAQDSVPPPELLRALSEHFESCVHGLGLVRKGWEQQAPDSLQPSLHILY